MSSLDCFCKFLAFISICVQERRFLPENFNRELDSGMVAIWLFNELRDFVFMWRVIFQNKKLAFLLRFQFHHLKDPLKTWYFKMF